MLQGGNTGNGLRSVSGDRAVNVEAAVMVIRRRGQILSVTEGSVAESLGNPCDLFSRSIGSLYTKGHYSSALSPERTEPIIHAQSCNNQTTKGSEDEPD